MVRFCLAAVPFLPIFLIGIANLQTVCAEQPRELLLIGKPAVAAQLVAVAEDGTLKFFLEDQTRSIAPVELVRWSTPTSATAVHQIILTDGSRIVLAPSWSGDPSLKLDANTLSATTKLLGRISLPRSAVRVILLGAPAERTQYTRFVDSLLADSGKDDRLLLAGGDVFKGSLVGIEARSQSDTKDRTETTILFQTELGQLELAESRVAAVVCAKQQDLAASANMELGLRDGSRLKIRALTADANHLRIELASGTVITGSDCRDVVSLQSLGEQVLYLSDLDESSYRHVPYLEIPWPFLRDRSVLGGPLVVGGDVYSKGLGMHSASRLTYRLDGSELNGPRVFLAQIALDDAAADRGSVIFRVYLQQNGTWWPAFTGPTVCGGDAPRAVSVELGGATGLALVTDYADQGDELDYANWLDARLVRRVE